MKYITADYIIPVTKPPIKNGYVLVDNSEMVIAVSPGALTNAGCPLETYSGIITPGFINVHCHLELSYLKSRIPKGSGLIGFIKEMLAQRNNYMPEDIQQSITDAENEMYENGIVAVADIANDNFTFLKKAESKIYFHTLIEAFDIVKARSAATFQRCIDLASELKTTAPQNSSYSIVPHAPYTVTADLFELIKNFAAQNNSIQSMHNQECEAEGELFLSKKGPMYDLFAGTGDSMKQFVSTGKNSLQSVLNFINPESKTLLVHNTYTSKEDIEWAQHWHKKLYWCFCPNANLYIENRLPDFKNFIAANAKCCVGTDSYASNWSLNILDELKTISKNHPEISLLTLLNWATINGAEYLEKEKLFGSIEPEKKPGLNLIENVDLINLKLNSNSTVKKII